MRNEAALDRFGAWQHGLVVRPQLLAAGVTAREIDHVLATARLVAVHKGVYRLSGAPITWNQMMLAATLAAGGVGSHRAAPSLWGVELPGGVPPMEVSVTRPHCPRPRGVIVHRSLDLSPDQVVRRHGAPVTNPLRMLVDLGAVVGPDQVAIALESLTSRKIVTVAGARAFRERLGGRGRRGAGVQGEVLDRRALGGQRADSMLEPVMAELCRSRGIPEPDFQVWVLVAAKWRRMDFVYMAEMLDIELDGYEVDGYEDHGAKFDNWLDDKVRDAEITALGW